MVLVSAWAPFVIFPKGYLRRSDVVLSVNGIVSLHFCACCLLLLCVSVLRV